jgi:NAD-dependent dihydropyrimidine dehydrogenase PreA subunit
MIIDENLCIGCGRCKFFCPVGAIGKSEGKVAIDADLCVECGTCERVKICPCEAIVKEANLPWPRILRRRISDLVSPPHATTGEWGRGTSDMKSSDVSNRYRKNEAGFGVEFGRPGAGVRLEEVEKALVPLVRLGVQFVQTNPITALMSDPSSGIFKEEVKNEKVLSAIIEFVVESSQIPQVMEALEEIAARPDNVVFSVGIISVLEYDGSNPNIEMVKRLGYGVSPNGKTNLGLGRICL